MGKTHEYRLSLEWQGDLGSGTSSHAAYSRAHVISGPTKDTEIQGTSDPAFRGDKHRYNPEELLVAALSACHMLWMLHLCANAGIVVVGYADSPEGTMVEQEDGAGQFTSVVLHPELTIQDWSRSNELPALHEKSHSLCFIARSVNFPVTHVPKARLQAE